MDMNTPKITLNTEIEGSREEDIIQITDRALNEIIKVKKDQEVPDTYGIRVGIRGQSCSGMQFGLGFDQEVSDMDKVFAVNDINFIIDRKSLFFLEGITIDYVVDINGTGFIFNNPYDQGCGGCGGHH
jgi:iron-sulfur cluster assembly protein